MIKHLLPLQYVCVLAALMLTGIGLNAQSNWHNSYTSAQVKIDYSDPINCSFSNGEIQAEYVLIKITNLTNHPVNVSFRADTYYLGSGCATCTNDEYKYSFNLPANGVLEGNCNNPSIGKNQLVIFKKYISKPNYREFEKFELTNFTVE